MCLNTAKLIGKEKYMDDCISEYLPREKLLNHGAHSLSDVELLAIFLRVGIAGKPVLTLANDLLNEFGTLRHLMSVECSQMCKVKGLGPAKFVQLQAALEMSKRYLKEVMFEKPLMDSPNAVRDYLHQLLSDEPYEQFWLVHLDNQHRVLNAEMLFKGTIDAAAVYPRVVIDSIIKNKTAAVIFAHNHPSGICEPSNADIQLTKRLKEILQMIDVRTLDHFVVGHNTVTSFAERGLM